MATSGTINFNLNVEEIIEKAFQMVGGELVSGEDLRQAKKSLNLLLIDLQNRGHPLAKMENITFSTSASVVSYTLPARVVDVLDTVAIRSGTATPVRRMSLLDYHTIPRKTQAGLPTQYALDRDRTATTMYLYLAPTSTSTTIDYWALTRIEDANSYLDDVDLSFRFQPALVFGLAYFISLEKASFDPNRRNELKSLYADALTAAMSEDRERVSYIISPYPYSGR